MKISLIKRPGQILGNQDYFHFFLELLWKDFGKKKKSTKQQQMLKAEYVKAYYED